MPWRNSSPMDLKTQFIADYLRQTLTISDLCLHFNISRKTAYKWIHRYLEEGPAGSPTAPAVRTSVPIKLRPMLLTPFSKHVIAIPPGAPRSYSRFFLRAHRRRRGPHGQRSAIFSRATA